MTITDDEMALLRRAAGTSGPGYLVDGVKRGLLRRVMDELESSRRTIAEQAKEIEVAKARLQTFLEGKWELSDCNSAKEIDDLKAENARLSVKLSEKCREAVERAASIESDLAKAREEIEGLKSNLLIQSRKHTQTQCDLDIANARLASARSDALAEAARATKSVSLPNEQLSDFVKGFVAGVASAYHAILALDKPKEEGD